MGKIDFHTHPNILKNPPQAEEFVKKAIDEGFDTIVFTDHMPFSVTGDEIDRMPFGAVPLYCEKVREIAEKYRDRIRILCGIEVDYYPSCTDEITMTLAQGDFDIILGSSHLNIKGLGIPFRSLSKTDYAEIVINNYYFASQSGMFDVLTHPDIYRIQISDPETFPLAGDFPKIADLEEDLRRLFSAMEEKNIMMEINAAPLYKKFDSRGPYPDRDILAIASEYNLKYTFGSDAHIPENVGFGYDTVKELASGRLVSTYEVK